MAGAPVTACARLIHHSVFLQEKIGERAGSMNCISSFSAIHSALRACGVARAANTFSGLSHGDRATASWVCAHLRAATATAGGRVKEMCAAGHYARIRLPQLTV